MLVSALFATSLASLAIASPTPPFHARQINNSTITLVVTNFTAFMADPYVDGAQSNLSFHLSDTRPGFYAEVDCVIPPTYFNLYAISALFDWCGNRTLDFSYSFNERGLTVRRGWKVDESTYITGSGTQSTYWADSGPEANVTTYPDGKLFTRANEWSFPLTRLQTGAPP